MTVKRQKRQERPVVAPTDPNVQPKGTVTGTQLITALERHGVRGVTYNQLVNITRLHGIPTRPSYAGPVIASMEFAEHARQYLRTHFQITVAQFAEDNWAQKIAEKQGFITYNATEPDSYFAEIGLRRPLPQMVVAALPTSALHLPDTSDKHVRAPVGIYLLNPTQEQLQVAGEVGIVGLMKREDVSLVLGRTLLDVMLLDVMLLDVMLLDVMLLD